MPDISIILCTHNPRHDFLAKTLEALRQQSLPKRTWELLIIDNASSNTVLSSVDLSWHPSAKKISEPKLGLTPARLCGIAHARAPLLVFVDDDNILAADYLEASLQIAKNYPYLGAFGGSTFPEFEIKPETRHQPYLKLLAIREINRPSWCLLPGLQSLASCPFGTGLCLRESVAREYSRLTVESKLRTSLDRCGAQLSSFGDVDMALTACDCNMGIGLFRELKLTHLIPKSRLQDAYLLQLQEAMSYSHHLLRYIREGYRPSLPTQDRSDRLLRIYKRIRAKLSGSLDADSLFQEKMSEALLAGIVRAMHDLSASPNNV
ncbi:MAG: glycosyltransferase [Methylacidiphilales bacterium]|nr:glycosyltransferase [Candidatus Methylacidiphilales bacterium]